MWILHYDNGPNLLLIMQGELNEGGVVKEVEGPLMERCSQIITTLCMVYSFGCSMVLDKWENLVKMD